MSCQDRKYISKLEISSELIETHEFQFRLIIPTTRPTGRLETEGADDPTDDCVELAFRGASSALLGTRWTSSSSSSERDRKIHQIKKNKMSCVSSCSSAQRKYRHHLR